MLFHFRNMGPHFPANLYPFKRPISLILLGLGGTPSRRKLDCKDPASTNSVPNDTDAIAHREAPPSSHHQH